MEHKHEKKNRKFKFLSIIGVIVVFIHMVSLYFSPKINIHNNTNKTIYIYFMQKKANADEPSTEEIDQLKNIKIINPDEKAEVAPSLKTLFSDNMELSIGWKIGSRIELYSKSGHQGFVIDSINGECAFSIHINENDVVTIKNGKGACYKKISPLNLVAD
ncbi:hypothetical protein [Yersinia aleksiciae]|uniref:Uncharacterized protein n=1 Tax=Yersinia aleksiciae TaxID=263819 RepID=A0A0T9TZN7_YERAE|nr:hypothetical protein [Yersinia aleksiciae]CNL10810.1 Uncharacterised protein [Yersinia aleksiciae]